MYNFVCIVNVLLSIATNIPVLLITAFVLQGHIYWFAAQETFLIIISVVLCFCGNRDTFKSLGKYN